MHVADHVLNPTVCLAAGAASAAAIGYSIDRLRRELTPHTIPLTGAVAALIFAGQMINFTLPGLPVSGHLIGGVLAAAMLGPWAGLIAVSLVLLVQCLLFADGGLTTLGINILNMGVIGVWGGHLCRIGLHRIAPHANLLSLAIASWFSVVLAAIAFATEFTLAHAGEAYAFGAIVLQMLKLHALIGIGEAVLTTATVALLATPEPHRPRVIRIATAAAFLIALAVSPFASSFPDGLEAVAEQLGFAHLAQPTVVSLLDDYALPLPQSFAISSTGRDLLAPPLAGLVGVASILLLTTATTHLRGLFFAGYQRP